MAAALGAPSEAPPQSSEPVVRPASPYGLAAGSSPAVQPVSRTEVARPAPAVTGRCVDWEHGNPLLGCEIAIAGFSVRTRSDADGRFTLPLPSGSRGADRRLRIGAQGRLSVERVVPAGGELGEVRLRLGVAVSGTLHDDALAPQGGATVRLRATAAGRGDGWSEHWSTQAVTDFEGSFAFADVVPAGVAVVELDEAPPLLGSASHALGPGDRAFLAL
ncbi:MAG: hypothetical protein KDE27_29720, partial [Planctomycetes bacterium]|nr:hypothetical protein [Planctomycetota bacterium]